VKKYVSRKWRNWNQNEVDEEIKGADSRDKVKQSERSSKSRSTGLQVHLMYLYLKYF